MVRVSLRPAARALAIALVLVAGLGFSGAALADAGQCRAACDEYAAGHYAVDFAEDQIEHFKKKLGTAKTQEDKLKYHNLLKKVVKQRDAAKRELPGLWKTCLAAIAAATPKPKEVTTKTCDKCQPLARKYDKAKYDFDFEAAMLKTAKKCTDEESVQKSIQLDVNHQETVLTRASKALHSCELKHCVKQNN